MFVARWRFTTINLTVYCVEEQFCELGTFKPRSVCLLYEGRIWSRGMVNYKIMLIYIFPKKVKTNRASTAWDKPRVDFKFMTELMKNEIFHELFFVAMTDSFCLYYHLLVDMYNTSLALMGSQSKSSKLFAWEERTFVSCTLHFLNPYNRF